MISNEKITNHNLAVSKMPKGQLQAVPNVSEADSLSGDLRQRQNRQDELEALELCQQFANEFNLSPEDVRPCIALIYYQGVSSQREPYAFIFALELNCLGLNESIIYQALQNYNSHLDRRLLESELRKFERKFKNQKYDKPYSCKKSELRSFCIGEICPWAKIRQVGKPTSKSVLGGFLKNKWPSYIADPYLTQIYLGLQQLRMLKGYQPGARFSFNYQELERESGINRRNITNRLKKLSDLGLVDSLKIGSSWGNERKRTRLTIVHPIPDPIILGHKSRF